MVNITLLISTLVILIAFIYFLINLDSTSLERLNNASSLISAFSSLVTLILALLLFNKFGVEKNIKDKNIERIDKLLEEIRKIRIVFQGDGYWIQFYPLQKSFYNAINKVKDKKLAVNVDFVEKLDPVLSFSNDPFLPKDIAKALDDLQFIGGSSIKKLSERDYAKGSVLNLKSSITRTPPSEEYVHFNAISPKDESITLEKYREKWRKLIMEIKKWLKNNSSTKNHLNIDIE